MIKIAVLSLVYKEHPESPFSRIVQLYYKTFLGLFRISKYYDSYSAADNAPIEWSYIFNKYDYKNHVIWEEL